MIRSLTVAAPAVADSIWGHHLRWDFVERFASAFVSMLVYRPRIGPLVSILTLSAGGQLIAMAADGTIFLAVFGSKIYFFLVQKHRGTFDAAARCGLRILRITVDLVRVRDPGTGPAVVG